MRSAGRIVLPVVYRLHRLRRRLGAGNVRLVSLTGVVIWIIVICWSGHVLVAGLRLVEVGGLFGGFEVTNGDRLSDRDSYVPDLVEDRVGADHTGIAVGISRYGDGEAIWRGKRGVEGGPK